MNPSAVLTLLGRCVRTERKSGEFPDQREPGRHVSYDYVEAKVVTPAYDVVVVRFDSNAPLPPADTDVVLTLDVRGSARGLRCKVLGFDVVDEPVELVPTK